MKLTKKRKLPINLFKILVDNYNESSCSLDFSEKCKPYMSDTMAFGIYQTIMSNEKDILKQFNYDIR